MTVKILTEHYLEFLSLTGGCTGSSESTLDKMPHCWKSHFMVYLLFQKKYSVKMAIIIWTITFIISSMLVEESYQNEEKLIKGAILNQMREWGKRIFQSQLYNTTQEVKKQYLVAAIVSPDTFNDIEELQLMEGCPIQPGDIIQQRFSNTSLVCARSAVIFNRDDEAVWERSKWHDNKAYKEHSWHGEYLFLHEGILYDLQKNVEPDVPCEMFLYSYFIPCNYSSEKQPYRCSELLLHYDNRDDRCKITTIGYTSAHPATAKNLSPTLEHLRTKYDVIKLAEDSKDPEAVLVEDAIQSITQHSTVTFQDVFYSCLRRSPLLKCCIEINSRDTENPDRIFSFYANWITREAVNATKYGGRLSAQRGQKTRMQNIFQSLINNTLGTDCPMCTKERIGLFVNACAKKAFDMADFFGKTDGDKIMLHTWQIYDDRWSNLFKRIKDDFWKTEGSRMRCLYSTSIQSLCTKRDKSPDKNEPFSQYKSDL